MLLLVDPVNLTVVEKVKLFTAQLDIKERNLRRRTQPVTLVELENACFYASLIGVLFNKNKLVVGDLWRFTCVYR